MKIKMRLLPRRRERVGRRSLRVMTSLRRSHHHQRRKARARRKLSKVKMRKNPRRSFQKRGEERRRQR